ncbi:nucleoside monophosphate kinase [Candidatus Woesearchaeota archaeon]|nr:nucleoside monophosphate kinase [Candidatus Woesearchaeota archaeon]
MNIIIFGPPGIGKGSVSGLLKDKYRVPHISTGNIFRESSDKRIRHYLEKGLLVPDEDVMRVVEKRLGEKDCQNGFILDGFPRTLDQAGFLEEKGVKISIVLNLVGDTDVIVARLSGRLICPKCGAIYHIRNIKPKKKGICDKCGTELVHRKDDQPDVVRNRIDVYRKQTKVLIEYYRKRNLLVDIQADGQLSDVVNNITAVIEDKV